VAPDPGRVGVPEAKETVPAAEHRTTVDATVNAPPETVGVSDVGRMVPEPVVARLKTGVVVP